MNIQSFDLAIIGGGMVGLALANALADSDLSIAVIEGRTPDLSLPVDHEIRVSALSQASKNLLSRLGAWAHIEQSRHQPYQGMQVWDQDSFGKIAFDASQLKTGAVTDGSLGAIVENSIIQAALWQQAEQASNITLFHPFHCQSVAMGDKESWLNLTGSGEENKSVTQAITTKLVVGADGANSWLRSQADIPLTSWDYGHHALVATIETDLPHDAIARQAFLPQGPLAFLPLDNQGNGQNLCSIVWSLPPEQAAELKACDEVEFNRRLTTAIDNRLGYCQVVSPRGVFPLKMRYARSFAKERIALIGDAAHTIHPLAGLGVNLGFLDAASLAQTILDNHQQGKDIGELANLRSFERWRKSEAMQMIAAMESFKQLFAGANPVKKLVRDLGLVAVDKVPPVKEMFIRHAMGLTDDLPELSKPLIES
ncbi:FAD-dependent monooxygenase [Psychrobium sp. 1_MG-2023]|uniref:FAD-dependent monooxygenase n=1 Tax=Psychrobium sp. 1_MG-2023 TaxID=3062624 RepID=UPI000C3260DF|nr:FAD-dependent monooxygenase [Psychrobium sp. 1_MG-2023]MDP2562887.1 FAD-dependent monooxygenase [Psychrobium sp. 1_MG-2023]PKF57200.1 FAD-dependent 2-octaprenylphenol hydroxylase [Alteromonadales bacterium alter-6D02]